MKHVPSPLPTRSRSRNAYCVIGVIALITSTTPLPAANVWDGGGSGTFNWSDNLNWDNDTTPIFGTLTFSGSLGTANVVDVATSQNSLLWTGSNAWSLSNSGGASISLTDASGTQARIENQSTGALSITAPIFFAASNPSPPNPFGEINAINQDIVFGAALTVNGVSVNGLKFGGTTGRNVTFNNAVSATGKWLATSGGGSITVGPTGSITASDVYIFNGGSLNLSGSLTTDPTYGIRLGGDLGTTGAQDLTKGGSLNLTKTDGGLTFSGIVNSVASNTSESLVVNSKNTSGTNTLSGPMILDSPLAVNQSAGGTLALTTGGVDLKGNLLTLNADSGATINASGVIANSIGSGSLMKSGPGLLTISGANTFTGPTTINGGILKLGSASALGTSSLVTVDFGGTLDTAGLATARPLVISGIGVSGNAVYNSVAATQSAITGGLTLASDASIGNVALTTGNTGGFSINTITLAGNTLTLTTGRLNTTNLTAGNINVNFGAALILANGTDSTGTITINTGGILAVRDYNNSGQANTHNITLNGGTIGNGLAVEGNGGGATGQTLKNAIFVDAGGGTLTGSDTAFGGTVATYGLGFSGSFTGSGPLAFTGGKGIVLKGDTSGYTGTATNSTTLLFSAGSANQTFNGVLAGSGSLTQAGTGVLTLAGNNTYTGATTVSAGTLVLAGANTGNSAFTVAAGATLRLDYASQVNSKINDSAVLTLSGGTIDLANGATSHTEVIGSTTLTAGTSSVVTQTNGTSILDLKTITPNTGAITFSQSGIARTNNANNANGVLGVWAAIGTTGQWAMNDGSGLIVAATTSDITRLAVSPQTILSGSTTNIRITEGTGVASAITLGEATTTINSLSQSAIDGTSAAIIDPAGQVLAVNSILLGSGAGPLTIGTGINNGTLKSAGTLLAFRDLAGAGITVNSSIVNGTAASGLSKYDLGVLTLNGANTYSGATSIYGGTLKLGSSTALPTGGALVLTGVGTTLNLNGNNTTVGTFTTDANATVTDAATSTGSSTFSITTSAGSLACKFLNGTTRTVALRVTNANGNFLLTNAGNTFAGGIILTNGTRMSPGTITAGAYGTGSITVGEAATDNAGIFFATATQTLPSRIISNTALGTDRVGTFRIDATAITLSGQLTANLAPLAFSTNGTGTVTASGKITGPSGLTLLSHTLGGTSLGVTISNNTNDYAGDTIVNQNPQVGRSYTLTLGAANVIPNGLGKGNVTVNSNGTGVGRLNLGGFSETINGLSGSGIVDGISGSPTLTIGDGNASGSFSGTLVNAAGALAVTKVGTGIQTFSGTNTYTGATTINAGILVLNGTNGAIASSSGITFGNGASLTIANTSAANNGNRIAGNLAMNGGVLNFTNDGGAANYTETAGNLNISGGANTIATSPAASGQTSALNFAVLNRTAGSVDFVGSSLGLNDSNRVTFTGGVVSGQAIGSWATYNGTDLAAYDSTNGVVAFSSYTDVTRLGAGSSTISDGSASNVRIVEGTGGPFSILLGGATTTTISTLTQSASGGASAATLDPAGKILETNTILVAPGAGNLTIGTGTLRSAGTELQVIANGNATINSVIANGTGGASTLIKGGSGTVILTGTNTYTGTTTISSGTLQIGNASTTGSLGTGIIANAGTLNFKRSNALSLATQITGAGTVIHSGAGTLTLTNTLGVGANNIQVATNAGAFGYNTSPANNTSHTLTTGTVSLAAGTALNLVQTNNNGYGAAINYTLGSTLSLNGNAVSAGSTNGAMLQRITSATAFAMSGANSIAQSNGGFSQYLVIEGPISGTGTLTLNRHNSNAGSSSFNLKGSMAGYSGKVTVGTAGDSVGSVIFGNATGWGTGSLTLTGTNSNVLIGDKAATDYNGGWTGGSALSLVTGTISPAGMITVGSGAVLQVNNAAANAILVQTTGGLTVNGGTVAALGSAGTSGFVPNGTWTFGGTALSTISANVQLNNTGTTFLVADAVAGSGVDTTISGQISGTNGFTKTGLGTLALAGSNSYSGPTVINAGTLFASNTAGSATGTGSITVKASATLAGTGIVNGPVVVESLGGIAPGSGVGTLTTGPLTLAGIYDCTVDAAASDLLVVNGNVDLTGATLTVTGALSASSYNIATYTGTRTGTFTASPTLPSGYVLDYATPGVIKLVKSGYATWAAINAPTGGAADDFDGDAVSNGVEYVLGGSKDTNDTSKLPQITSDGTNIAFTFTRSKDSISADTTVAIQVDNDMIDWPISGANYYLVPSEPVNNNPGVAVIDNAPLNTQTITLTIPIGAEPKLFVRLAVAIATTP